MKKNNKQRIEKSNWAVSNSLQQKMTLFQKAMRGDPDALIECSYQLGMYTKEQYDDYQRIKKTVEGQDDI